MANPKYTVSDKPVPVSELVATLSDGTKVKRRVPRMRACNEKDEKGKMCAGHLKRWFFYGDEVKMNRSVAEIGGSLLVVSNFTLYGDCSKGRRPGFDLAAPPEQARALYEYFLGKLRASEVPVETGIFQASMAVHLVNDGPVTLLCESKKEKPHRNGS